MKKKYIKPIIFLCIIILFLYIGNYTNASSYLNKDRIQLQIQSYGYFAPIAFILLYMLITIFFVPGTPFTILSGILFGSIFGTTYTVIGATLGASIAFGVSRLLGKDFVDKIIKNKFKGLNKYDEKLKEYGLSTMLFFRIVPLFPFNGLNFAMGLTRISFKNYFIGTLVGIIPGSFILANIGNEATGLSNPKLYSFIAIFILMALIPTIYKKWKK